MYTRRRSFLMMLAYASVLLVVAAVASARSIPQPPSFISSRRKHLFSGIENNSNLNNPLLEKKDRASILASIRGGAFDDDTDYDEYDFDDSDFDFDDTFSTEVNTG